MLTKAVLRVIFICFVFTATHQRDCFNHSQNRGRPNLDTSILSPSGFFQIHYDLTGDNSPLSTEYIFEVAAMIDSIKSILIDDMGFLPPINDNDGIYDIYIQDLGEKQYGFCLPDIPSFDEINDYVPSTYIKIDNAYEDDGDYFTSGLNTMRLTLAHEYFHAVQAAYREKNGSVDTYFYEMMGMWIEDVIVPDGNDYIHWVHSDEFNNQFFMSPEMSMVESDGYSLALFIHYLNNIYSNGNSIIVRKIWEEISQIAGECGLTCGINSIKNVLLSLYNVNFEEAWADFTSRLVFNSSDDYGNNLFFHEDQINIISLLTYLQEPENISVGETLFSIDLNNESSRYKLYQTNSMGILSFDYTDVSAADYVDYVSVISGFGHIMNQHYDNLSNIYVDTGDIVVLTTTSSLSNLNLNVKINYSTDLTLSYNQGDSNLDGDSNIQDIILIVDFLLYSSNFNPLQFLNSDINSDNLINIFDVILLIELILD